MSDFKKALADYRLTTAEILYHLPDHPSLLQTYVWQEFDLSPKFPRLQDFLVFWHKSIEGRIHSVRVIQAASLSPALLVHGQGLFEIH